MANQVIADLGAPESTPLTHLLGSISVGGMFYVFVQGQTGDIYCKMFSAAGGGWTQWLKFAADARSGGLKHAQGANGVVAAGSCIWVYACGNDGNLWCHFWNGAAWTWVNLQRPAFGAVRRLLGTSSGGLFAAYVEGSDGKVWSDIWNGAIWTWGTEGKTAMGVLPAQFALYHHASTGSWATGGTADTYTTVVFSIADGKVRCLFDWTETWTGGVDMARLSYCLVMGAAKSITPGGSGNYKY